MMNIEVLMLYFLVATSFGDQSRNHDSVVHTTGKCPFSYYEVHQSKKSLLVWDGIKFTYLNYCNVGYVARNDANVATSWQVCFVALTSEVRDCDAKVEYYEKWSSHTPSKVLSCNDEFPHTWCSQSEFAAIKITSTSTSNSIVKIEVYGKPGVDLSIVACLGIVGAIFAVIGIISLAICCKYSKKGKKTEGRIVTENDPAHNELLIGGPTTMEVMVPAGSGRYRPKQVMVQHTTFIPQQNHQPDQPNIQGTHFINSSPRPSPSTGRLNENHVGSEHVQMTVPATTHAHSDPRQNPRRSPVAENYNEREHDITPSAPPIDTACSRKDNTMPPPSYEELAKL